MDRKTLPIFLIVLVDILGLTIILPLLPFYAERYGATPLVVGLLTSSFAACQFFSGPMLGRWSDRIGRKPLLLASQFGTFMGFIILALSNSLWLILLSRIIDGCTAGNISLAQAYISDVTEPRHRAKAFGKIGVAFGIGFFLGPALTGLLSQYDYRMPILAAAGLSALSMLATATLMPGRQPGEAPSGASAPVRPPSVWNIVAPFRFLRRPELVLLLVQVILFYFEFSAYVSGFALFAERRFTWGGIPFGPRQVGYVFAYFGFLGIILQGFLLGPLVSRMGERKLARAGFAASLAGYGILSFIHEPSWILVTGLLTGFGSGVIRPVLVSELSQNVARNEQGEIQGLNQSLNSVAQVLAPIASTVLIQRDWLVAWAWLPAALCAVALLLVARPQVMRSAGR